MAGFEWTDLITPGFQLGGKLVGDKMSADASKYGVKENARQFDINTARSDASRNMLLPNLQQTLGTKAGLGATPGYAQYGGTPSGPQSSGGGGAAGALGKAGNVMTALGTASTLGVPGLGFLGAAGPWGAAAGGGIMLAKFLASKIGQGRQAADRLTGTQGAQGQFSGLMQELARRQADGRMTPEQVKSALAQGFERNIQSGLGAAGSNKNDQKVMRQWLGDFSNEAWMRDHPELNPIAQRYLGSMG
jgi:hypothetical protein